MKKLSKLSIDVMTLQDGKSNNTAYRNALLTASSNDTSKSTAIEQPKNPKIVVTSASAEISNDTSDVTVLSEATKSAAAPPQPSAPTRRSHCRGRVGRGALRNRS